MRGNATTHVFPRPAAALLAAVALALLSGCSRGHAADDDSIQPKPPPGPSVAERVQVLQADALVIDGRHIRLADVVAPLPIPHAHCWAEAVAAKQATLAARELVRSSTELRIETTGKRDEYDREIAHVFLDNQDLAEMLHDAGFLADAEPGHFDWCAPVSAGGEGAPDTKSLLDFGRG